MRGQPLSLEPLSAAGELEALRRAPSLLPYLLCRGLSLEDSVALAHNAALLSCAAVFPEGKLSPVEVLRRLSLEEIACCCQELADQTREGGDDQ